MFYQADGVGGYTFFASGETEPFGRGGFDADAVGVNADDVSQTLLHGGYMRIDFGALGCYSRVNITNCIALGGNEFHRPLQKDFAVDALKLCSCVGEMEAYVAHIGSSKQSVTDGVDKHIGIRVTQQTQSMFYLDTAEPQIAALNQAVYVETKTYAKHGYILRFKDFTILRF